jgi:hypothetical protein
MTKRSKNWFFTITNVLRSDNTWGGVRFRKRDKPTQETMKDLCDSITFKEEPGDKATDSIQGLVKTVDNANAKANNEPDNNYTYVPKVSQLPTIEATSQNFDTFSGNVLDITTDVTTVTRNKYLAKFASTFVVWLLSKLNGSQDITKEVRVATTSSIVGSYNSTIKEFIVSATGALIIDGVALNIGDRVLLKNQTIGFLNGIYTVTSVGDITTQAVLTRASDFDSSSDVKQFQSVYVLQGGSNSGHRYIIVNARDSFILDTTTITFSLVRMVVGALGNEAVIAHSNYFTGTGFAILQNSSNGSVVVNAPNTGKVFIQNQNTTVAEFSTSEGEKFNYPVFRTQDIYLRDGVTPETYKKVLQRDITTPNQGIFKIGEEATRMDFQVPFSLPSYTVASVPSAVKAGQMIYVSNESGGPVMAFSNGTNWLRCTDRAIIS